MGRTAFITGGLGGIGSAIASALHDDGWKTWTPPRRECDVRDASALHESVGECIRVYDRIDAAICCAGVQGPRVHVSETITSHWYETMGVNFFGTVNVCRAVVPWMQKQGSGRILTFSGGGIGGSDMARHRAPYVASKAAVVAFTEALALELEPAIIVNAVAPGKVATRMTGGEGESPDRVVRMVKWLLESPTELTGSGRLYSAAWDTPWQWGPDDFPMKEDDYKKLRRETFGGAT